MASDRNGRLLAALMLVVAGSLAYANSFPAPLVLDDRVSISENQQIREWWRIDQVLRPERELPVAGRPLVNLSLALNYAAGGEAPEGYRAVNLVVHLLCGLALFGLVRRVCLLPQTGARWTARATPLAFGTAAIWILHPLNTEVVDYLTQRTESMMALCYLLTLLCAVRALEAGGRRLRWQAAAVVCCALGMACKESMVTAPVAVLLLDRTFALGSTREMLRRRGGFYAALFATWGLLALLNWSGPRVHSAGFSTSIGVWTYLLNQTVMIVQYLRLAIWPQHLVVLYGWPVPLTLGAVAPQAAVVVTLLVATAVAWWHWSRLAFLGSWFFLTLAPTSSLVPIATEVGAERRMYLPLIALCVLAVAAALTRLDRKAGAALLAVVCAALGTTTFLRNTEYTSPVLLAQTAVDRWPTPLAHHMLGEELLAAGRHDDGVRELRLALAGEPRAHYTLGVELFSQGTLDEAVAELQAFIAAEPLLLEVPHAEVLIGQARARQQRWPEAERQARQAIAKLPGDAEARLLLADALFRQERLDDAVAAYRIYLRLRPDDLVSQANLAIALAAGGHPQEAVAAFRRIAELTPRDGSARRNLATALLDANQPAEAEPHARAAVELLPADALAHDLLGLVLARLGRTAEARGSFTKALQLDPANADARMHLAALGPGR